MINLRASLVNGTGCQLVKSEKLRAHAAAVTYAFGHALSLSCVCGACAAVAFLFRAAAGTFGIAAMPA